MELLAKNATKPVTGMVKVLEGTIKRMHDPTTCPLCSPPRCRERAQGDSPRTQLRWGGGLADPNDSPRFTAEEADRDDESELQLKEEIRYYEEQLGSYKDEIGRLNEEIVRKDAALKRKDAEIDRLWSYLEGSRGGRP